MSDVGQVEKAVVVPGGCSPCAQVVLTRAQRLEPSGNPLSFCSLSSRGCLQREDVLFHLWLDRAHTGLCCGGAW